MNGDRFDFVRALIILDVRKLSQVLVVSQCAPIHSAGCTLIFIMTNHFLMNACTMYGAGSFPFPSSSSLTTSQPLIGGTFAKELVKHK